MTDLKTPIPIRTAFADYQLTSVIGEGGGGKVYGGIDEAGKQIAVKVMSTSTKDKRKRFKNETAFLTKTKHPNIVNIIDFGIGVDTTPDAPFYVMPRYSSSLRKVIDSTRDPARLMPLFSQMLDGVEAAHMLGAVHRDLKPENFLYDATANRMALADFGIASFTEQDLLTLVETKGQQRMANFYYAAPEQKIKGATADARADIYALGLMLNEFFTGEIPHGTNHKLIGNSLPDLAFLDDIVAMMMRQSPSDRPSSIAAVKQLIEVRRELHLNKQRLDNLTNTVVYDGDVTDPLAFEPPVLTGAFWDNGTLTLTLDRDINDKWTQALRNMGNFSNLTGHPPETFHIQHGKPRQITTHSDEGEAQALINHFKPWLIKATQVLHARLTSEAKKRAYDERERLNRLRELEEARMRVNSSLKI